MLWKEENKLIGITQDALRIFEGKREIKR